MISCSCDQSNEAGNIKTTKEIYEVNRQINEVIKSNDSFERNKEKRNKLKELQHDNDYSYHPDTVKLKK